MNEHEFKNKQPLFTGNEIVQKTIESLQYQIQELEREELILKGKKEALQTTLTNMSYLKNQVRG